MNRLAMLVALLPSLLLAQAAAGTAVGAGRAATTAAPAQAAGKSIAGAFDSLNRTLQHSENSKPAGRSTTIAPTSRRARSVAVKPKSGAGRVEPTAEVSYEDPSGIQEGMEYAEVVHRFGPPSLKLTNGPGEEMLYYSHNGVTVNVTIQNGKVTAVQNASGTDQTTAGIR